MKHSHAAARHPGRHGLVAISGGRRLRCAFAGLGLLCALAFSAHAHASGRLPWEDFDKRLKGTQSPAALGSDLFGDRVGLQNGGLSFEVTDVSLPGSNALPVAFTRRYEVINHKDHNGADGMLGDWNVVVPSISGSFAPNWESRDTPGNRCSDTQPPPLPDSDVTWTEFWHGLHIEIPGVGGGELLGFNPQANPKTPVPGNGATYKWVTNDHVRVSCLSSIDNYTGDGFLAITPDGTKYWFKHMAQYFEPTLETLLVTPQQTLTEFHARRKNVLYATRVEDRFGNWVTYTYTNAWNAPGKLTGIQASDGRALTIGYTNGRVSSVSDGTRAWSYAYATTSDNRPTLHQVTLPDTSKWTIDFDVFTDAEIEALEWGENDRNCHTLEIPSNLYFEPVGSVTHPSGAVGTFTLAIKEHGRSNVPLHCGHVTTYPSGAEPGTGNNRADDINMFVISSYSFTLVSKEISGPGLTPVTWAYSYFPNVNIKIYEGTGTNRFQYPVCTLGAQCYEPPCTSGPCGASLTTVAGPDNEWTRYQFGNSFRYNEGKLLSVERGSLVNGVVTVLETMANAYDMSLADQAYPASFGSSLQPNYDGDANQWHRPLIRTDTTRQGETFTWEMLSGCTTGRCANVFAAPTMVRRYSTLGFSRTESTVYQHDLARWVINLPQTSTCTVAVPASTACNGDVVSATTYDADLLPFTVSAFGKLQHTLTYYADGTLKTYKDGRNNVTTLSSWYRGVPRSIVYPDATSVAATVGNPGTITSVTDENGYKTCYAYDTMGRLSSVTYPSETLPGTCNTTTWNATTQGFVQASVSKYGIPAGHWQQTVQTGNGVRVNYFDAMWRPLIVHEYDADKLLATQRFTRFNYDHAGRTTFASYPSTGSGPTTGTRTTYNPLGQPLTVKQDSAELGVLTTRFEYLAGFQTRVTNPRGFPTTTNMYLAHDEPTTAWPLAITQPEGVHTDIVRSSFGSPTSITRRNSTGSVAGVRRYVYNAAQELCKTIEPEVGSTVMGYDAAGNLAWSAAGQALPNPSNCDLQYVPMAARINRLYDARNRLTTLRFPDGLGDQDWSYTADGLAAQIVTYNDDNQTVPVINAYQYNRRRLLAGQGESLEQPGWYTWGYGYGYNANGHLAVNTYPSGLTVDYAPNALGQPERAGTYATDVSYHPNGAIKQFTYGNGIIHAMTQDSRGLPARSRDAHGSTAVLDDSYEFDANGNVAAISDGATGAGQHGNRDMTYDGLDRLRTTASPMFNGITASYDYDVLDNLVRVQAPGRDHDYHYDAGSQRLTSVSERIGGATVIGLGYDAQGNVANKNGQLYDFDQGNRLRAVAGKEGYRYDGHGRRVLAWSAQGLGNILFHYARDGRLIFQSDARVHQHIDYIHLGGSLVARRELPFGSSTAAVKYQHTDALGSPVVVTDAAGIEVQRSEYEPYGKLINRSNNNRPGYTGHVEDAATGLTYMQQRYYDPAIGMFLSVDPVTAYSDPVGQFHRYRYANNNPYKFIDPDGRESSAIRAMERDNREFLRGEISETELTERRVARGRGAAAAGAVVAAGVVAIETGAVAATVTVAGKVVDAAVKTTKNESVRTVVCLVLSCSKVDPAVPRDAVTGEVRRTPTGQVVRDLERRRQNKEAPTRDGKDKGEQKPPPPPRKDEELVRGV